MISPRAAYAARNRTREQASMRLMTALDASRVELIKREFETRDNHVDQPDFIAIMLKHLPAHLYSDHENAADELLELFKEVDVNGDGTMDWEELTRFMVSKAALLKEQGTLDFMLPYHHNTQLEGSTSVSGSVVPHRHRDSIDGMCVLPRTKQFACIENHSPVVTLYNSRNSNLVATMKCTAVPLCVCYIEPLQSLVACCSDSTMARFNVGESHHKDRHQMKTFWPTPDAQMAMCWQPTHNLLYSGSVGGRVHAWDVEKREQRCSFEAHTDIVMDVLNLDCLDSVVSASLDTNIIVVDSYTEQQTARLVGHTKGVNSLCYSSNNRFLISSGFDHDVFVWSPFVSTLLYKLKGHRSALVGCEAVEGSPELITADASGLFKLWDLRTFQCVQTFTSEHEAGDLNDLTGTLSCFKHVKVPCFDGGTGDSEDYRIIAASKKLLFFDQERMRAEPVSDEGPIRVALFNSQSLTIFTASERSVKVWDAILGSVKHSFKNITSSEISAACLDDGRERKFILGESSGSVSVWNYQSGALMKQFSPQASSPVVDVAYSATSKSVLVAYMDGLVRVFDENDIETCKVLRSFDDTYSHRGDLYCAVYYPPASIVATGGNLPSDGVRLWDYDSGKYDFVLKTGDCEVVTLAFLGDYPLLAVCSSDSKIRIYGIHQSQMKGNCVIEWTNELPVGTLVTTGVEEQEAVHLGDVQKTLVEEDDDDVDDGDSHGDDEPEEDNGVESDRRRRAFESLRQMRKTTRLHGTPSTSSSLPRAGGAEDQYQGGMSSPTAPASMEFESPQSTRWVPAKKLNRSPVSSAAWDPTEECLYTGSEGGQLRKWGLAAALAHVDAGKLEMVEVNGRRRVRVITGGGSGGGGSDSGGEMRGSKRTLLPNSLKHASGLVDFRWGLETAHDADVTVIVLTQEPRALITASTDRRVLMFSLQGKRTGVLLQSIKFGAQSPQWSLDIDVGQRQKNEASALSSVLKSNPSARSSRPQHQPSSSTDPMTSAKKRSGGRKGGRAVRDGGRASGQRSSASDRTHKRVIEVLAKVKNVNTSGHDEEMAFPRVGTTGPADSEKPSLQSTLVGNPRLREKNRRLPPHLKAADPISSPPIELSGLGPGFEHHQQQRERRGHGHVSHTLPRIGQASAGMAPGSSGRDVSDDVLASMKRLNMQLTGQGTGRAP